MKHLRKQLLQTFITISPMMTIQGEAHTIHSLRTEFMRIHPNECCPSDQQIRMAADLAFKHGGYEGGAKTWITRETFLQEQNMELNSKITVLQSEVAQLKALANNPSQAGRVLRLVQSTG